MLKSSVVVGLTVVVVVVASDARGINPRRKFNRVVAQEEGEEWEDPAGRSGRKRGASTDDD